VCGVVTRQGGVVAGACVRSSHTVEGGDACGVRHQGEASRRMLGGSGRRWSAVKPSAPARKNHEE